MERDEAAAADENVPFHTSDVARIDAGDWSGLAGAYLTEVLGRTGSQGTLRVYRGVLQRWFASCPEPRLATAAQMFAFAYRRGPRGHEPSPPTITVRLAALDGLYDFARRMGVVTANPATDVRRPRSRPPVPKGLAADELRRLLAATPASLQGKRDRALLVTLALTGLRRAEVLSLRAGDLLDGGRAFRVRVKGGFTRQRELPRPALVAILEYLDAGGRQLVAMDQGEQLFPLTSQSLYRNLERYARLAGLGHVTPHTLRHSAAKLRRAAGASIEDVQALLGHRSLATTARYLARLESEADAGWAAAADLLGL